MPRTGKSAASPDQSVVLRYAGGAIAVLAALGARMALDPIMGSQAPYIPFIIAIVVASRYGGRGPGLAATAISGLAVDWFYLQPRASLAVTDPNAAAGLALFFLTGVFISFVLGGLRKSLPSASGAASALGLTEEPIAISTGSAMRFRGADGKLKPHHLWVGAAVLLVAIEALLFWGTWMRFAERESLSVRTREIQAKTESLFSELKDAETGQRGYLLTGQDPYLAPYNAAVQAIPVQLDGLRKLTIDPGQQARIASLRPLIAAKLAELKETIDLRRTGAAAAALQVVSSDRGQQTMDQIRDAMAAMRAGEESLLEERSERAAAAARGLGLVMASGAGLLLIVLLAGSRDIDRNLTRRQQAQERMRESEERYRTLFNTLIEGFCIIEVIFDAENRPVDYLFLEINEAFEGQTGLKNARGRLMRDLAPEHEAHWFEIYGKVALTGQPASFVNEARALGRWYEVNAYRVGAPESRRVAVLFSDISERKRAEFERETAVEFLQLVSASDSTDGLIRAAAAFFQTKSDCQAVGIRLKDGEDYPYYEARGFPPEFVLMENSLCAKDEEGEVILNSAGYPVLECMCGNVLCGRIDPSKPFFSQGGSFWTNNSNQLLGGTTEADRQGRTRNRCNGQGYESVALIPLRSGAEVLGLLQLNDRRTGMFSPAAVALWERLSVYLAAALTKIRAEEALRESEAQFRTLANAIPQLCWMANADGWIFWYNERWYEYTGKTPEQMEGWGWQSVHDPEALPGVLERWKVSLANGEPFDMVFPLRGADGVFRPFLTRVMPVRGQDGKVARWFGTNTDITERKRAEDALLRVSAIVESSDDAIIGKTLDGAITSWNLGAARLYGYSAPEIIGRHISALVPADHPDDIAAILRRVAKGERVEQIEAVRRRKDGSLVDVSLKISPIMDASGNVVGASTIARDITERKRAEEEIRRLNADLEDRVRQRTTQLEAANKELEAFAYSVSHDLRTPLRGIDGWSLALVEDYASQLDEKARGYVDRVRAETQRMGTLIDDLLQLSRVTRSEMATGAVDLTAIARRIAARLTEDNSERGIEFTIAAGLAAHGDTRLLEIALDNLFANAVKFTGTRAEARIEFGRTEEDGERPFYVRDNGVGFDMAFAGTLFGAFQRLHRASEFPGTGIGLATVQRIIHRHGGRIWAEAEPDRGATFYFTLGAS